MSLLGVESYLMGLIDGLTVTGQTIPPLQAWVMPPPVVLTGEAPQAFVWGDVGDEQRATVPRGTGQKRTQHTPTVTLMWTFEATDQNAALFPLLVDAVLAAYRTVALNSVAVTDPVTGAESRLTDLGERMTWQYLPPVAASQTAQQLVLATCTIRLPCHEWFVG
jgi:hypothetical protein